MICDILYTIYFLHLQKTIYMIQYTTNIYNYTLFITSIHHYHHNNISLMHYPSIPTPVSLAYELKLQKLS